MKPLIISLLILSASAGCAVKTGANGSGAATPLATANQSQPVEEPDGYASAMVAEDRYEVTYSGPWSGSRDTIEGVLLYRAALLSARHGKTWFRLLHMPGEAGPLSHPARPATSIGAAYGHWQPHWSYRTASGWQPWRPEWGVPFWAETADAKGVERVNVHAMVEMGSGTPAVPTQTDFDVAQVLRDMRPASK